MKNKLLWILTLLDWKTNIDRGIPMLNFSLIDWFDQNVNQNTSIFEYGCGGSTIFLSKLTDNLVSVEHDREYFSYVKQKLSNDSTLLIFKEEMDEYISSISGFFDMVFVDGRERKKCLIEGLKHVKKGGYLILDDSNRKKYHYPQMKKYEKIVFRGPRAYTIANSKGFLQQNTATLWKIS